MERNEMAREKTGQRHKNKVYFKVQDLYLQAFPLNHLSYCGGAAGEVFYAASRINEKDLESWVAQWSTLATRLEAQAPRPLFNADMKLGNLFSKTRLFAYEKFFEWQVGAASYAPSRHWQQRQGRRTYDGKNDDVRAQSHEGALLE
jgi:hypothetical protein